MPHFQNNYPFSKKLPIFKIITHFQNIDPFSKYWPTFKILQGGHWGLEDYRLPFFKTILSTNYQLFDTLLPDFIDFSIFRIFGPGTRLSTQPKIHHRMLAHFWMWLGEEAKMGPTLQILCTLYFLYFYGYVQRILKILKIID